MRALTMALAACALSAGGADACDDHHGTCEMEDWRWSYTAMMKMMTIEGVTTCDEGRVNIRLYDEVNGERKYLGNANGFIRGHAMTALANDIAAKPASLAIKYSIKAR